MLAIERRREILNRLGVSGKVLVSELSRDFGVTEETIRRDLEKLDNDGLARKTYGGAVKNENFTVFKNVCITIINLWKNKQFN